MLSSFQKCKLWKLGTRSKHERKICKTELNPNEFQAMQTTILGQSMTVGPWTTFLDHFMDYQPPLFPNRVLTIHSGIQESKIEPTIPVVESCVFWKVTSTQEFRNKM